MPGPSPPPAVRGRLRPGAVAAALVLCGALGMRPARAAPPLGLELRWQAPSGCPGEQQVRADIERLTGRRWEAGASDVMTVDATVARDEAGQWSVALAITRAPAPPRERRVEGGSCREVADAAAVIVALALGAPPPPPAPRPAPVVIAPAPPPPAPPPAAPPALHLGLGALGGVTAAALPAAAPGLTLAAALTHGRNVFELRGSAWRTRDAALSASSGAHVALYAGAARYCRVLGGRVFAPALCAGFEAGVLQGEGFGLRQNDAGRARWLAPALDARLLVALLPHVRLTVEAGALVPLVRDRFVVDDDLVYRPAAVDGRALAGLLFEWP